jgi:phospholipase C
LSSRLSAFFLLLAFALILTACGGTSSNDQPPKNFQLTVSVTGTGSVTSTPAGINCPGTCTASFPSGSSVTLSASAGTGFQFSGFNGACSGTSCQVTLSSDQSVSATFTSTNAAQLSVTVSGPGTVTSNPAGINCPSNCSGSFDDGTKVSLTATPSSGSTFSGFSGDCSGSTCEVTVSKGHTATVSAAFAQAAHDITAIKHIIVVTQENRSLDHYFGHLPDYWQAHGFPQATNGTTFEAEPANASNADPTGANVNAYNLQSGCTENPSPSWAESHRDRNRSNPEDSNNAPMDGFVITAAGDAQGTGLYDVLGHRAMGYFNGDQLNYYYFMASTFATSDHWFAPVMSRTQLNRMYLYGATSQGHVSPLKNGEHLTSKTIFELMQDNDISWKIYVHPDSSGCTSPSCLAKYSYLKQFTYGSFVLSNLPNQFASTSQLMSDIQNGTLPQVSFLEPAGYVGLDEHSNDTDIVHAPSVQTGANYIAGIVNTLMASPSWKDTVLILTYDEPGGFYDHVPPPSAVPPDSIQFPTDASTQSGTACANDSTDPVCGFFFTGFRVPVIVISPFTKANYVSHTTMDYTAMLKLIETRFKLPSLTARDAAQPDMTDFFDFANVPWATPPSNVPKQDQSMQCVLETLSGITVSPNPAPAGGQATVTLSLSKAAIQDVTVLLSSDSPNVVPPSAVIANTTSSTSFNINVPTGISSLTITGTIGGIPVSGTVPVQ